MNPARFNPSVYLASVEFMGEVHGCAFRTPPHKVGLTRMPLEAVPLLVEDIGKVFDTIPAVLGPEREATTFASLWSERNGVAARVGVRQGIYQLTDVARPLKAPTGRLRVVGLEELDIATEWAVRFVEETGVDDSDVRKKIREKIPTGTLWFWDDGEPRSMAGEGGHTPNGSRISWVFTPSEWRGRGYASACVAALSQRVLDSGRRFCFLYTDLSNPTSNSIYQKIGYEPVCEVVDCRFE